MGVRRREPLKVYKALDKNLVYVHTTLHQYGAKGIQRENTLSTLPLHLCVSPQSHGDISAKLPSSAKEKAKHIIIARKERGNNAH